MDEKLAFWDFCDVACGAFTRVARLTLTVEKLDGYQLV
jgi:hypothetical protein